MIMPKKPIIKIRLKILRYLRKLPMNVYEVSIAVGCKYETAKKHLEYLKVLEKAETFELNKKTLWRIKSKRR